MAGLELDPWEEFVLANSLGERADGKWGAPEVGVEVPRQNGKGTIIEGRELAGLFLLGERLIIHSAHQFDTSKEGFRRLLELIEGNADLSRRVKRVSNAHGEEGIELTSRQRIRFRTRTKGGGRGFTGDLLILDEAMELAESTLAALLPTLSARPNHQIWYLGSAVDQTVHDNGVVFSRVRKRGHAANDPTLAWFEWSADATLEDVDEIAESPEAWAQANPGMGIRISAETIAREQRAMSPRTFAVERLGVGDWFDVDQAAAGGIDLKAWSELRDPDSRRIGDVCFAFDVRPDRSAGAIAVAGLRSDGLHHIEVVEHRKGTGWIPERLAQLVRDHKPVAVKCDQSSPAASLLTAIANLGVEVETMSANEHAQSCGLLFDAVQDGTVRHLGQIELRQAIKGAGRRRLGEAWGWSRKASNVDISPLVACTLALYGFESREPTYSPSFEVLA